MNQIIEIVKIALNIGLIFLDIVVSIVDIYSDVMDKFKSDFEFPTVEAIVG